MKKICITIIMLSIMMVAFAIPCSADQNDAVTVSLSFFGPNWDINHDGTADGLDVSRLVYHFSEEGTPHWIREDINDNGAVDGFDVSMLVYHFSERWLVP